QVSRAFERQLCVAVLRLELFDIRLVGIDLSLKGGLLQEVEEIALLDLGTFHKQSLLKKSADPGNQCHPPHRLDAPDKLLGLGDLLALGAHDPDRGWPRGSGLGVGGDWECGYNEKQ